MNIKVTAFTDTKKLHYTQSPLMFFVFIVFAEEGDRLVDVYVNNRHVYYCQWLLHMSVRCYRISKKSDLVIKIL